MGNPQPTYPGGAAELISHWQQRRAPIEAGAGEGLPALSVDLADLAQRIVPSDLPDLGKRASDFAKKQHGLARLLAGHSELALLNALLIAHLRKRGYPDHAPALFLRLWHEQGPALLADLPPRWLISSAITFAEHGATEADRSLGQSLNVLFSLMKLYEFERQFSGAAADTPFPMGRRLKAPLPMGMPDFALATGGLDINLLAPIWLAAQTAPGLGPLACHLLMALNDDPETMFRRIGQMKEAKRRQLLAKAAKEP